jgi:hypothetical protein
LPSVRAAAGADPDQLLRGMEMINDLAVLVPNRRAAPR